MSVLNSKITVFLILLNAVLFILETKDGGSTDIGVALKYGAFYPPFIRQGQYYRYWSSMFLHFGICHLLFNMQALYTTGPYVEYVFGSVVFLMIYLLSGLVGNIATLLYYEYTERNIVSAGASGCIFGLLGVCFVLAIAGYGPSLINLIMILIFNLIYGLSDRRINMIAHAGGFITGVLTTVVVLWV